MPAPKGNKFWEARTKHGREKNFSSPEALWAACVEYFEHNHANPLEEAIVYQGELNEKQAKPLMRAMTIDALCLYLECDLKTWRNYRCQEGYEEYFPVVEKAEMVIRAQKFEGAAAGLLNPNIIARDLGLKDTQEHDHKSTDGSMSPPKQADLSKLSIEELKALAEVAGKLNKSTE